MGKGQPLGKLPRGLVWGFAVERHHGGREDGTSVVTYGELARVDDHVIFSMPVGGTEDDPRLHPVRLAAALVDWQRTDRYAASARYQQYVGRAESDYQRLTDEVA